MNLKFELSIQNENIADIMIYVTRIAHYNH